MNTDHKTLAALDVVNCARCGGNHPSVEMKPFTRPCGDRTHFGVCPANGEPILGRITQWDKVGPSNAKIGFPKILSEEQETIAKSLGWHQESEGLWNNVRRHMHGREVADVLEDIAKVSTVETK